MTSSNAIAIFAVSRYTSELVTFKPSRKPVVG